MKHFSHEQIEMLKAIYPAGTRIELVRMEDSQAIQPGTKGTVTFIDDMGTIHMQWDDGRTLGLIPTVDIFRKL